MMLDPILEYTSTGSNREVYQLSSEPLVGLAYYKARQLGKKVRWQNSTLLLLQ
jgi:hypothetical protein